MLILDLLIVIAVAVIAGKLADRFKIKPMKYDMSLTNTKLHGKFMTDNDLSLMDMNSDENRWKS